MAAAKEKSEIKYATAQAKLSEDEALRIRYKHGTPLEGGKIADSEPVDLFSGASNVQAANKHDQDHHGKSHDQRGAEDKDTHLPTGAA
ncbi:SEED MATURATION PROTEIN 1 [Linum grandiflorum]